MDEKNSLAEEFEADRGRLRAVAYRMLGSRSEADDAVQEAWIRLARTDASGVDNLQAWLTTVVARVCLDMLRSRKSRREDPIDLGAADEIASETQSDNPEHEIALADAPAVADRERPPIQPAERAPVDSGLADEVHTATI